jgi:preprotein translocase subunit SecG
MGNILLITQIIISVVLVILILMQPKGVGLGRAWGGAGEFYKSKRGVERIVFYMTLIFTLVFLLSSFAAILFS